MNYSDLYIIVLLAYLPGLALLAFLRKTWKFPILNFAFVGMFLFNALGAIGVFNQEKIYIINFDSESVSEDLALVLILQVVIYYILVVPYLVIRTAPILSLKADRRDSIAIYIGLIAILLIGSLYYNEVGSFLLFAALDGSMNIDNAYQNRVESVYGLANWPFYNLGFVFLPVFISSYAFVRAKVTKRLGFLFYISIMICFGMSLTMGSKAGLINFVLTLSVAYAVYLGAKGQDIVKLLGSGRFVIFVIFALIVMVLGYVNATPESLTMEQLARRLWYRAFVTYPETIAASISYATENDFLGVGIFPTAHGFLSHEYVNLPLLLHQYIAGAPGGMNVPFAGEAFIASGWVGVAILCSVIFLTLITLQEIAFRLTSGLTSLAFSCFYAYMAIQLSINGMFAALFTFMYPGALLALAATTVLVDWAWCKLAYFAETPSYDQSKG